MLAALHLLAFWATVALVVALAVVAAVDTVSRRLHRLALDRLVLGVLVGALVAGVTGVALLVIGARPADPLHALYGVAAPVVLGVARWLGARPEPRRRAGWLLLGAVVVAGVLLRLWTTAA